MTTRVHASAAGIATVCIVSFWVSTVVSELLLSPAAVVAVKRAVLYAMSVLIPAIAVTGASGFWLGKHRTSWLLDRKKKRMAFIAMNGLLILLPAAVYLYGRALAGEFDSRFYLVQAVELLAGAANLTLMSLNVRDGLALRTRATRPADI